MNAIPDWILFSLGSAFFAGLTAIFGKLGVGGMNSNLASFIRTVVILLVTAGIVSWRGEWQKPEAVAPSSWLYLVLSGLATGLSWLCYFRALQSGPISRVAPLDKLSVAFAIILGLIVVGEKPSWPMAIGASLIVAGSIVIVVS
ncbi:MAG TPA: EamA family transporter [Burkholderiaceae bacterium]